MNFSKVRTVKSPNRGTSLSAGIDFFVPEFDQNFIDDFLKKNEAELGVFDINLYIEDELISVEPGGRVLIPSGIHVNLADLKTDGIALIAHNKSGVATKKGLDRLAEVVDEDYQGEIHISVVNTGNNTIQILPNDKLVQFLLIPVSYSMPEEIKFEDLYTTKTDRGDKGFGEGTGL